MKLIYLHGWNSRAAGAPYPFAVRVAKRLAAHGVPSEAIGIWLGDYVSLDDNVTLPDLTQAFERALGELGIGEFAAITHSTGGVVLRQWILDHAPQSKARCTHLVSIAGPHQGSPLAQLGKSRVSRMGFWACGAEPGVRLLDWLELGAEEQWRLNERWLGLEQGPWLFSLAGQTIDNQLYHHLNSYTGEPGSDGVVRACSANLNYSKIKIVQKDGVFNIKSDESALDAAFGIIPKASHSGHRRGILHSDTTAGWAARCLAVRDAYDYAALKRDLEKMNSRSLRHNGVQITFRLTDQTGQPIEDFDLLLTGGRFHSPNCLPKGFFIDRQANSSVPGRVTYYLNYDPFRRACMGYLGFRVDARPQDGSVYYASGELRSTIARLLRPNQSLMVDIQLERRLARELFRLLPLAGEVAA